ncbi:MAG: Gfo/Idh/MocA family oxidoreductase [bacterium]|nr:Gfo/Idh/MocA family oxidoreductase [bacterium]
MADKIRWGILSAANIGRKVIPSIHDSHNGVVAAVASRDLAKASAYAAELNIPKAYGSYDELLADPQIDAIYIPLPNGMHHDWSIKCAQAGKHTLCEKPLADTAAQAQQMLDAFQAAGLKFAEAFMYRFHPQTLRVRQMIEDGAVGNLRTISAAFTFRIRDEGNVRLNSDLAGGGLMDVGCYPVSLMRLITGEEPIAAKAVANFGAESGVDEMLSGVLHFPSQVIGHFDCGLRAFFTNTYEIRGSHGRIVAEWAFTMPSNQATTIRYWNDHSGTTEYEEITIAPANSYQLMVEDFADAILNDRPPTFGAHDAVNQMRAVDMLYASARA